MLFRSILKLQEGYQIAPGNKKCFERTKVGHWDNKGSGHRQSPQQRERRGGERMRERERKEEGRERESKEGREKEREKERE